ncbi:MAG: nickel-dependent hydrogenase large subunit [Chitinivibrionia bacterium]|nr:nickel-dependent hydrogenase large subunit [Chitinivibrionia bacterium]
MRKTTRLQIPLNRVEGDLEVKVDIAGGRVEDAWCSGTMFRGFEQILLGRGALDGLVITPRICGICSTAHLMAACRALDAAAGVDVPDNAHLLRNVALLVEHIHSDVRQIVAVLGGQWPHSSYMVPGGVVSVPSDADLIQCLHVLVRYRRWYEKRVLGCDLARWSEVRSAADLDAWLAEGAAHRDSEVGFYLRFAQQAGLDAIGAGHGNFLSYGALDLPQKTRVKSPIENGTCLMPAGFARGLGIEEFDQEKITEHVSHSWFEDQGGPAHPLDGRTVPYASGCEGEKYSWAKAPRYDGVPAETGPLAEMVVAGRPLFLDMIRRSGPSVLVRELARLTRPAHLLSAIETWLREISESGGEFYNRPHQIVEGVGTGLTQASRGALGHWVKIQDGKIVHYQIITPTAWHASPRDEKGIRGTLEEALAGTPVLDLENPVEIGHVIRSFDPCLVCTVHGISRSGGRVLIRL